MRSPLRRNEIASGFLTALSVCLAVAQAAQAIDKPEGVPADYKLLYAQDFSQPTAIKDFVMADPKAWVIAQTNGAGALELITQSHYNPPVRSPFNLAVIADRVFGDFVMDVELTSTIPENPHRDMCLSFAMSSATQFYYAHLASTADGKAHHNIFIVNDQPRTNIANLTTSGVKWGSASTPHKIRLEHNTASGDIKVYFDDFTKPVLAAQDKTLKSGCIGFGSFDDAGKIANIRIWGPSMESKKTTFYNRPGKTE